jgi:hypothetical protein
VMHSAAVTIPAVSMLLAGASTGTGMLGQLTDLPLTLVGAGSTFHDFAGRPWIADKAAMDGQALVWNGADNKFYGVLNGGGAWKTGVLVSFDPATDAVVLLKTLSGRTYPAKRGLGSDMLPFNKVAGFYRNPLFTLDGKGLLLLSTSGGVDTEGLLVHVNIDPTSATYLADTVVHDFFDYELDQTNYCKSIRVANLDGQTEMAWGKNGTDDVIFMARVGEQYVVGPNNAPNEPGTCAPYNPLRATSRTGSTGGCSPSARATPPTSRSPGSSRSDMTTRSVPVTAHSIRCFTWDARSTGTTTSPAGPFRPCDGPRRRSTTRISTSTWAATSPRSRATSRVATG